MPHQYPGSKQHLHPHRTVPYRTDRRWDAPLGRANSKQTCNRYVADRGYNLQRGLFTAFLKVELASRIKDDKQHKPVKFQAYDFHSGLFNLMNRLGEKSLLYQYMVV